VEAIDNPLMGSSAIGLASLADRARMSEFSKTWIASAHEVVEWSFHKRGNNEI
jgi:hypothetical protein